MRKSKFTLHWARLFLRLVWATFFVTLGILWVSLIISQYPSRYDMTESKCSEAYAATGFHIWGVGSGGSPRTLHGFRASMTWATCTMVLLFDAHGCPSPPISLTDWPMSWPRLAKMAPHGTASWRSGLHPGPGQTCVDSNCIKTNIKPISVFKRHHIIVLSLPILAVPFAADKRIRRHAAIHLLDAKHDRFCIAKENLQKCQRATSSFGFEHAQTTSRACRRGCAK